MSVPELPYKISFSEEALACLRRMTKIVNNLRLDFDILRLNLNNVHKLNQKMLQNFKLQMQPQTVPVSDLSSLTKPTSSKIVVSSEMAPDPSAGIDSGGVITQGLRGSSNHDPHISRLQTQTRFFTPLSCDLEPEITKPTPRKIVVSYDLALDPSASIGSGGVITQGFRGPFLINSS